MMKVESHPTSSSSSSSAAPTTRVNKKTCMDDIELYPSWEDAVRRGDGVGVGAEAGSEEFSPQHGDGTTSEESREEEEEEQDDDEEDLSPPFPAPPTSACTSGKHRGRNPGDDDDTRRRALVEAEEEDGPTLLSLEKRPLLCAGDAKATSPTTTMDAFYWGTGGGDCTTPAIGEKPSGRGGGGPQNEYGLNSSSFPPSPPLMRHKLGTNGGSGDVLVVGGGGSGRRWLPPSMATTTAGTRRRFHSSDYFAGSNEVEPLRVVDPQQESHDEHLSWNGPIRRPYCHSPPTLEGDERQQQHQNHKRPFLSYHQQSPPPQPAMMGRTIPPWSEARASSSSNYLRHFQSQKHRQQKWKYMTYPPPTSPPLQLASVVHTPSAADGLQTDDVPTPSDVAIVGTTMEDLPTATDISSNRRRRKLGIGGIRHDDYGGGGERGGLASDQDDVQQQWKNERSIGTADPLDATRGGTIDDDDDGQLLLLGEQDDDNDEEDQHRQHSALRASLDAGMMALRKRSEWLFARKQLQQRKQQQQEQIEAVQRTSHGGSKPHGSDDGDEEEEGYRCYEDAEETVRCREGENDGRRSLHHLGGGATLRRRRNPNFFSAAAATTSASPTALSSEAEEDRFDGLLSPHYFPQHHHPSSLDIPTRCVRAYSEPTYVLTSYEAVGSSFENEGNTLSRVVQTTSPVVEDESSIAGTGLSPSPALPDRPTTEKVPSLEHRLASQQICGGRSGIIGFEGGDFSPRDADNVESTRVADGSEMTTAAYAMTNTSSVTAGEQDSLVSVVTLTDKRRQGGDGSPMPAPSVDSRTPLHCTEDSSGTADRMTKESVLTPGTALCETRPPCGSRGEMGGIVSMSGTVDRVVHVDHGGRLTATTATPSVGLRPFLHHSTDEGAFLNPTAPEEDRPSPLRTIPSWSLQPTHHAGGDGIGGDAAAASSTTSLPPPQGRPPGIPYVVSAAARSALAGDAVTEASSQSSQSRRMSRVSSQGTSLQTDAFLGPQQPPSAHSGRSVELANDGVSSSPFPSGVEAATDRRGGGVGAARLGGRNNNSEARSLTSSPSNAREVAGATPGGEGMTDSASGSNTNRRQRGGSGNNNNNNSRNDASGGRELTDEERQRQQQMRILRINHYFHCVIALVALLFSMILFAILVCWVVLTSAYVVSIDKPCDVPLKKYYWFATLQLILDVFRTDIMKHVFRWDPNNHNNSRRIPARVIVYNIGYLTFAVIVLKMGIESVFIDPDAMAPPTCPETAPELFQTSRIFVALSILAWSTIVIGYIIPFCFLAILLTRSGYSPRAGGAQFFTAGNTAAVAGAGSMFYREAADPQCIDQLRIVTVEDFPDDYPRECCICMGEFAAREVIVATQCDHVFHKSCCREWLSQARTCPVCRTDIPTSLGLSPSSEGPLNSEPRIANSGSGELDTESETEERPHQRRGRNLVEEPRVFDREEFSREVNNLLRILRQHEERLRTEGDESTPEVGDDQGLELQQMSAAESAGTADRNSAADPLHNRDFPRDLGSMEEGRMG